MTTFTREVERAQQAGVTHPENLPFLFEPQQTNGHSVLLVHGFGASPYEMRPVGESLCQSGYLTLGARLEGHGTSPEDLVNCRWQDWLASIMRSYEILEERGLPIALIGQSTGALLSLVLADRQKISRQILLSPLLKLRHPLAGLAGWLKYLIPFQQRQLANPQCHHYYERRPLAGIEQIGLLRDEVEPILARLVVPTLLLAAAGDRTVAPGSGRELFLKLGSRSKKFHRFGAEVPHVLSTDENPRFDETCRLIEDFLAVT